jgi:hypothetical protein
VVWCSEAAVEDADEAVAEGSDASEVFVLGGAMALTGIRDFPTPGQSGFDT